MKVKHILFVMLIIVFLIGCKEQEPTPTPQKNTPSMTQSDNSTHKSIPNNDEKILTYPEFQKLAIDLEEKLKIKGFYFKNGSSNLPNITFIDKKLTFGTRDTLVLSGSMNPDEVPLPTHHLLIFEDHKDKSKVNNQLVVRLAYTKSYIGNDIVDGNDNFGFSETNQSLAEATNLIILSYKNLIISVQLTSQDKADGKLFIDSIYPIVEMIKNY
ncbi:hypothetical protein NQ117_13255 [Paenibacillus sp. SC116]|uniref:hypothetical protein n=1 Tax=Paenibacillus sp. SC116 TaxID=2968986 RepID=UPI00215A222E|nr:hypothetical protein [Paenibacillus sp. SC116]MCR8844651.1 hypothetical protein [Paenibacillus sp. SC116]